MEINTAAPRSSAATPAGSSSSLVSNTVQTDPRETEYGCVDWYPYASDGRGDWFEYHDHGLAVAIA